jgi:hypothetical protein
MLMGGESLMVYAKLCGLMSSFDMAKEGGFTAMRVTQVWRSASASRKGWAVFWLSFFVLQIFTGSKVGVVATGGIFLLQLVMLFRRAKEKETGNG